MAQSDMSKVGDKLWPWFEALGLVKPGDDGAPKVFANALSDVAPATFAKALQHGSKFIYNTFRQDAQVSAFEARIVSKRFKTVAKRQYERLQMASGAPNTGPA